MSGHYQIFIPAVSNPTDDQLREIGVDDLIEGLPAFPIKRGILCAPGTAYVVQALDAEQPTEVEVVAADFEWAPSLLLSGGESVCWYGIPRNDRPGPRDLRRETLQVSSTVTLGGDIWDVASVPELKGDHTLYRLAHEMRGYLFQHSQEPEYFSSVDYLPGSYTLAAAGLRANYRLPFELCRASMLSLFDSRSLSLALLAACGVLNEISGARRKEFDSHTTPPSEN